MLAVNKKRKSDTRLVNVEVLPGDRQDHHRPARRQAVPARAGERQGPAAHSCAPGLYVGETLISEPAVELTFDQTSTDQRDRYQSVQLLLNQDADDYNNRAVEFRLEERIPNTNQWRVFAKAIYTLKRSFTSDFDF